MLIYEPLYISPKQSCQGDNCLSIFFSVSSILIDIFGDSNLTIPLPSIIPSSLVPMTVNQTLLDDETVISAGARSPPTRSISIKPLSLGEYRPTRFLYLSQYHILPALSTASPSGTPFPGRSYSSNLSDPGSNFTSFLSFLALNQSCPFPSTVSSVGTQNGFGMMYSFIFPVSGVSLPSLF